MIESDEEEGHEFDEIEKDLKAGKEEEQSFLKHTLFTEFEAIELAIQMVKLLEMLMIKRSGMLMVEPYKC